jgi:hypothetical protein
VAQRHAPPSSWPSSLSPLSPARPANLACGARSQRARGPPPPQNLARERPSRRLHRPWGPLGRAVFPNHPSCLTPTSPSAPSLHHITLSHTEPPHPSKPLEPSPSPWWASPSPPPPSSPPRFSRCPLRDSGTSAAPARARLVGVVAYGRPARPAGVAAARRGQPARG